MQTVAEGHLESYWRGSGVLSLHIRRPKRKANYLPPLSSTIKNAWSHTSISPLPTWREERHFTLPYFRNLIISVDDRGSLWRHVLKFYDACANTSEYCHARFSFQAKRKKKGRNILSLVSFLTKCWWICQRGEDTGLLHSSKRLTPVCLLGRCLD